MPITLNVIRPTSQQEESLQAGYLYKDVMFDLSPKITIGGELHKSANIKDIQALYDKAAVVTSLKNILTTSPGEKLLNPTFGLDLRDFLFDTISETKGFFLGQRIFEGLTIQEPRIRIENINVIVNVDQHEYIIDITLSIPSLNVNQLSLRGVLNNDGYTFV